MPGPITGGGVSKTYVDAGDAVTLATSEAYTDAQIVSAAKYIPIADWYTDVQPADTNDDFPLYSFSSGIYLPNAGDKGIFRAGGLFQANATATVKLQIWLKIAPATGLGGIQVFDSGSFNVPVNSFWDLDFFFINSDGSSLGRAIGTLSVNGITVQEYISETDFDLDGTAFPVAWLNGAVPIILTGNAAGTGRTTTQITAKLATLSKITAGSDQNPS